MAQENLDIFRDAWVNQVRILTDAVDDITTIDDFLAVSENHILDDVNNCVAACQVTSDFCEKNSTMKNVDAISREKLENKNLEKFVKLKLLLAAISREKITKFKTLKNS